MLFSKGFLDKSLEMAIYCLNHSQETKNKEYELEATIGLSKLYAKQFKNFEKSLEYANNALDLSKRAEELAHADRSTRMSCRSLF